MTEEKNKQHEHAPEEVVQQDEQVQQPPDPQALADEYLGGWKKALADYDNLKKEMDGKSREWIDIGMMKVVHGLIPVYNNFCAAVDHIPEDQKSVPWVTGVMYIKQNLEELFRELGLEQIPTVGQQFDEKLHEALSVEEGEGVSGEIIKQVSVGFTKDGKVLVPAKVVVRK